MAEGPTSTRRVVVDVLLYAAARVGLVVALSALIVCAARLVG
ncbi:putative membrane protein [Mycobacterium xenopi 4042]|nr:putative membrane protein [Mycobacterium xenopi 4042]